MPRKRIVAGMNNDTRSAAARAVNDWLTSVGGCQSGLARVLDVTPAAVSKWMLGPQRPPLWVREAVDRMSDGRVPVGLWIKRDEIERVGAAMARFQRDGLAGRGSK